VLRAPPAPYAFIISLAAPFQANAICALIWPTSKLLNFYPFKPSTQAGSWKQMAGKRGLVRRSQVERDGLIGGERDGLMGGERDGELSVWPGDIFAWLHWELKMSLGLLFCFSAAVIAMAAAVYDITHTPRWPLDPLSVAVVRVVVIRLASPCSFCLFGIEDQHLKCTQHMQARSQSFPPAI